MSKWIIAAVCAVLPVMAQGSVTQYTDQGAFLGALAPDYHTENFSGVVSGNPIYAFGSVNYTGSVTAAELYPVLDGVSTYAPGDTLFFDFSSSPSPIYAVGTNFAVTDIDVNPLSVNVPLQIVFASLELVTYDLPAGFHGFVSTSPIRSVAFTVPVEYSGDGFATVDHNMYMGAVPEPVFAGTLAAGSTMLLVRRRNRA